MTLTLDDIYDFTPDDDVDDEELATMVVVLTRTDVETSVEPDDLAGTWTATSLVFSSVEGNLVSEDEVTAGAVLTLVLREDATYTFSFVFGDEIEDETGTYTVSGNTLTVTPLTPEALDPETMAIVRDGDTMTLTLDDIYDFTPDDDVDDEELATMVVIFTR
jgi:hypothetical protein